jgi:transposase
MDLLVCGELLILAEGDDGGEGEERKIHFFAMDLPHSDACLVQAYPDSFSRSASRS